MEQTVYLDAKQSSLILGTSKRSVYNILRNEMESAQDYDANTLGSVVSYRTYNGKVAKYWFREDIVRSYVGRKRVTKYKKTCVICGGKFPRSGKAMICNECIEMEKRYPPNLHRGYDPVALRSLWMVLTDEYWWKKATIGMIVFYVIIGIIIWTV